MLSSPMRVRRSRLKKKQDEIQKCYAIEDDAKALTCLKKVVKEASGDCKPRLVLLTRRGCTPCKEEKEHHKEAITTGTIQEVNLYSPEGQRIAKKNEIDFVPSLILVDCHDNIIYPDDA